MINLRTLRYPKENIEDILNLSVSEEQKGFVSDNSESLAQAYVYHDTAWPFAIYEDDIYEIMPAMCRDIKEYIGRGKIVIVDHAITSERIYDMFLDAAKEGKALTVKVYCDLEILRQRERARGDRCPGSAEASLKYLWPKDGYDLCIDNGKVSAVENAEKILLRL